MDKKNCKKFETCGAPICPLMSKVVLDQMTWFCDEEYCSIREYSESYPWIKVQRRLSNKFIKKGVGNTEKAYTITSLQSKKGRKSLTEEQKAIVRDRLQKARSINPRFQVNQEKK